MENSDVSSEEKDIYDVNSNNDETNSNGDKNEHGTPGEVDEKEEKVVTRVKDLLAEENSNSALTIGKSDLEKMFNM